MNENIGILPKLNDPSLPWKQRTKLAQYAWISKECRIPKKQQVLLNWVCQQLVDLYKKKKSCTSTEIKDIWQCLGSILHSLSSHDKQNDTGFSFTLMPQLLQVFVEVFSSGFDEDDIALIQLECAQMILSNSKFNCSFVAKFENYVAYISSLSTTFVHSLKQFQHQNKISEEIFNLLEVSINMCLSLQRRQTNHKKVFERACQYLLVPLVSVYQLLENSSLLQSSANIPQGRVTTLITVLRQILSDVFFRKEHLSEYSTSLKALDSIEGIKDDDDPEPKAKKARIGNYTKELFETLKKHCSQHSNNVSHEAISNFLPQLFLEFLKARRHQKLGPSSLEFDFCALLCSLLGVHFQGQTTATPHDLGLVYILLDALLSYDVYQVADDNANNRVQFKWFSSLADLLLKFPPSPTVFQCLQVLLQLNHYIIEPHLTTLLQHCWHSSNGSQTDHNMSSKDIFLSSLVKTYAKLRQFDKFISHLLESLEALNNVCEPWHGLSKCFREELIIACQALPFGLATSLWRTFNETIFCRYTRSLSDPNENSSETIYKFKRAVGIFQVFILNTSLGGVVDQHKTDAIVKSLSDVSSSSNTEILGPLFDALPKIADPKLNIVAYTSALVLYHALQEINVFLVAFNLVTPDVAADVRNLHWQQHFKGYLEQGPKKREDKRLRYIKVLVVVQRLRIYLRSTTQSFHKNEITQLINGVFYGLNDTSSFESDSVWDQQLWTVNHSTFSIAYWFTLCNYAPVLLMACSCQHQQLFVQYLIKTLKTDNVGQVKNGLTLQSISKALLNSAIFHQIPSMQKCFIGTLWHEIGQLSLPSDNGLHRKLLEVMASVARLCDDESSAGLEAIDDGREEDNSEDESSSDDESEELVQNQGQKIDQTPSTITPLIIPGKVLDKALQQLVSGGKLDAHVASVLNKHISLLSFLPLDWLADQSHVGCVLGLLACDALVDKRQYQESNEVFLRVPYLCRRLIGVVLNGCISRKRYLVHHIISMDCFLVYLLASCLNMTDIAKDNIAADQLQNVSFELLTVLLRYTLKTTSPIDNFIKKLIKRIDTLTTTISAKPKNSMVKALASVRPLLRVWGTVMGVLEQVVACKTSRLSELKMAVNMFSQIAPAVCSLLQIITPKDDKAMKHNQEEVIKDKDLRVVLAESPVLLDVFTSIIHVYVISQTSRKFDRFKEDFHKLSWQPILASFLKYAVDSVPVTLAKEMPGLEQPLSQPLTHVVSSLHLLGVIMSSLGTLHLNLPGGFHSQLLASTLCLLNHLDTSTDSIVKAKSVAMDVVMSLLEGCSSEMAGELLHGLSSELSLEHTNSSSRLSTCLQVWLMLLSRKFTKLRKKELRVVLPQVLVALQSIVQQSTSLDLSILTLELMTKVVSLGTSMVHPHHCSVVFHGCLLVSLDHNNQRFPELFHAQFSILSTILFHQSDAVYKAIHVFVTCVKNLLCSLCQYCSDRISYKSEKTNQDYQLDCAEKMARLYQEIASHKAALSKYVPYMIAEYIQQIQQVSIQEKIKKVLLPGIYCLLDSCGEHEMALLHAVLDKGSRQLFSSLSDEYNKFYKFKGKA